MIERDSNGEITENVRVLGGRGDQRHPAVLDAGQQGVLLGLREAVHLVDEQHGLPADGRSRERAWSTISRMSLTPASTAETSTNSRSPDCATTYARVVFPVPGRSPQDHRGGRGAGVIGGDEPPQGAARFEGGLLADDLLEGARPHPHRERRAVITIAVHRVRGAGASPLRGRDLRPSPQGRPVHRQPTSQPGPCRRWRACQVPEHAVMRRGRQCLGRGGGLVRRVGVRARPSRRRDLGSARGRGRRGRSRGRGGSQ